MLKGFCAVLNLFFSNWRCREHCSNNVVQYQSNFHPTALLGRMSCYNAEEVFSSWSNNLVWLLLCSCFHFSLQHLKQIDHLFCRCIFDGDKLYLFFFFFFLTSTMHFLWVFQNKRPSHSVFYHSQKQQSPGVLWKCSKQPPINTAESQVWRLRTVDAHTQAHKIIHGPFGNQHT